MEPYSVSISCPVGAQRESEILSSVFNVDNMDTPQNDVKKDICVQDKIFHIKYSACDLKLLRNSVNTTLDHIALVQETMKRFGPPASELV